ncbi:MAG: MetQ/NlpA family ABC transporter substrate-binding protein [Sphaerochaetaceae bacterium]|nr:MetQ/NlpA family ABC transporter substrate-binding protein [Sphaerochaetaceae bacterium]
MKKVFTLLLVFAVCFSVFAGGASEKKTANRIVVGATPEPHAEMLRLVEDDMKSAGYELVVKEFTDYVTPNTALEDGEIDANFFQHLPYMNSFNNEHGYHLVNAGGIHIEPLALYSKKVSSVGDLKDGAVIAIPNDPTNEGRALLLLASCGLIGLKDVSNLESTPMDIVSNPKNLRFSEIEAASLPRVLEDVDGAVINGNYAIPAGLNASKDGLAVEGADSPYVNIIAVKEGNKSNPAVVALVNALQSQKVRQWVNDRYPNGEVVPVF